MAELRLLNLAEQDTIQLRFQAGDRVECWRRPWKAGTIVKLFYDEDVSFPEGKCAPYSTRSNMTTERY